MSALQTSGVGDHAQQCLPGFLRLQTLRRTTEAKDGRLLRVLQLRIDAVSTHPSAAIRRCGQWEDRYAMNEHRSIVEEARDEQSCFKHQRSIPNEYSPFTRWVSSE